MAIIPSPTSFTQNFAGATSTAAFSSQPPRTTIFRRFVRLFLLGFVLMFFALAGIEAIPRVFPSVLPLGFRVCHSFSIPYTQYHEDYVVRGIPNCNLVIDCHPEYTMTISLNAIGFRDQLTEGSVRALVLGNSLTFGNGVEAEDTFCEQLESQFKVPFVNLAIGAYSWPHNALILTQETNSFHPKFVLLMLHVHDLEHAGRYLEWRSRPYPRVPDPDALSRLPPPSFNDRMRTCFESSLSFRLYRWHFNPTLPQFYHKPHLSYRDDKLNLQFNEEIEEWIGESKGGCSENWNSCDQAFKTISVWAREKQLPVVAALIPNKEEVYTKFRKRIGGSSQLDLAYGAMRNKFCDLCAKHGIVVKDLTSSLRNHAEATSDQLYFCWDLHLNKRGHQVVATLLAQFLRDHNLAP